MNESSLAVNVVPDVLVLSGIAVVLGIVALVCISFFTKDERKPKGRDFSEAFDELLCKYDLVGKADLKKEFNVDDMYLHSSSEDYPRSGTLYPSSGGLYRRDASIGV